MRSIAISYEDKKTGRGSSIETDDALILACRNIEGGVRGAFESSFVCLGNCGDEVYITMLVEILRKYGVRNFQALLSTALLEISLIDGSSGRDPTGVVTALEEIRARKARNQQ